MISLDPLHPLQSAILETLAQSPALTIETIKKKLKKKHNLTPSQANLYRIISQLIQSQVLVKNQSQISINLVWASHLTNLTEALKSNHFSNHYLTDLNLQEGEKKEFTADSLAGLDPIWNHLLIKLTKLSSTKTWIAYNSHPWYSLGMPETETRLYQSLVKEGINCTMHYGNNTFLDQQGAKLIRVTKFKSKISPKINLPKEGYALWICGDYTLECIFPEILNQHFTLFFQSITTISQFTPQLFADIFKMKSPTKITIQKSPKKSKKLKEILNSH